MLCEWVAVRVEGGVEAALNTYRINRGCQGHLRTQLADDVQHPGSVQPPLGCVWQGPLFLGEVHSHLLEGH